MPTAPLETLVMEERGFVLRVGDVDEDDGFVEVDAVTENHARRVQVVRGRVAFYTAVEKFVLRKRPGQPPNVALGPVRHALRSGVAQDQNTWRRAFCFDLANVLVAKTEAVRLELVRSPRAKAECRSSRDGRRKRGWDPARSRSRAHRRRPPRRGRPSYRSNRR